MNAGTVTVFHLDSSKVVAEVEGMSRATGVLAAPSEHRVYVSAAGSHELIAIDDRSHEVKGRVTGIRFPDGIAYAPLERRIFVSDEAGEADVAIDAARMVKLATIELDGEAGNTHYDSVSHCVVVAVQTRNQLAAIDPATRRVVARYHVPGSDGPHGFAIDEVGRLAFVTGEGNATLQVIDLRTMRVLTNHKVGDGPDVIAWDPTWRLLYVASEEGTLSVFESSGPSLAQIDELRAPHAHTVSVDPLTHRVYLPLENVGGHPILRVMSF
jgi:DNA-binding beta-propeller fold protein YncE